MVSELEPLRQWHPAFCCAVQLEFRKNSNDLSYESEHDINTKPIRIDFLVVKKNPEVILDNEIGKIFRIHNIMEYKSPNDTVNIDTFFKVLAYAYLYKTQEEHVDDILFEELTATIVREGKPVKLFKRLKDMRFDITNPYAGIYYIIKDGFIPFQIVVSQELNPKNHVWLTALTENLSVEQARMLIEASNDLTSQGELELANSVLQISADVNREQFLNLKGTSDMEALRAIMQPEIDAAAREAARKAALAAAREGEAKGKMEILITLVKEGLITVTVASNKLGISESEFRSYLN